jgi:CRP/FNR family transcriptional regulator, cyclic AMP receptor protein
MVAAHLEDFDVRPLARSAGSCVRYRAGDVVFRRGDPGDAMYVVLSGSVEVTSQGRSIEVIGTGDGLGILSLIDGKARSAAAIAHTDAELALIDARRFRYLVEEVPNFVWYVMDELAQRLRATNAAL